MRVALTASAIALVVAGLIGTTPSASAAVSVNLDLGNVAFGYSDGYWDRAHTWHNWAPGEAKYYRSHAKGHYYGHKHDHEKDGGYHKEWWHK